MLRPKGITILLIHATVGCGTLIMLRAFNIAQARPRRRITWAFTAPVKTYQAYSVTGTTQHFLTPSALAGSFLVL